jgi:V8-like Glu-specific endopeptidase
MVAQCYWVTIPGGWISSGGDRDWDYAVIEFNNASCPLKPGATVGWLGWGTQSDATIESNIHYVYGYPGNFNGSTSCGVANGCFGATAGGGGSCFWPKIWGWGMSGLSAWSTTLSHDIDTSGGQSGSGLYNTAQGFRKVVGVHVGCQENLFGDYNEARRIDSSVVSFIQNNSAL